MSHGRNAVARKENAAGMDYTEKYELDTKAGNRLGRRLRALGGSIGKRVGKIRNAVEAYDPNAFDGDGDGLIQDGSPWERPVVIRSQVSPSSLRSEGAPQRELPEPASVVAEARMKPGSTPTVRQRKPGEVDVYEDVEVNEGAVIPTPPQLIEAGVTGVSVALRDRAKELRERDYRLPGATADMTPEELAELAIRPPSDESMEYAIDQIVGHPDDYPSEADYARMRELVKAHVQENMDKRVRHNAIKEPYDAKYGTGAFDEDAHRNRARLADRLKELIGDGTVNAILLGTADTTGGRETRVGLEDLAQSKFIDEMIADPNIPKWKRELYVAVRDTNRRPRLFATHVPSQLGTAVEELRPTLSPIHAFFANIFAPDSVKKNTQADANGRRITNYFQVRGEVHELTNVVNRPWNSQDMTAAQIMEMMTNDYYDWASRQKLLIDKGITRDGTDGNLPTPEQVRQRFRIAALQPNVHMAMFYVFPGQTKYEPYERMQDGSLSPNSIMLPDNMPAYASAELRGLFKYNYSSLVQFHKPHSSDEQILKVARASFSDMLRKNPMILEMMRRFGVPTIRIIHPMSSGDYLDMPDTIQLTEDLVTNNSRNGRRKREQLLDLFKDAYLFMNGIQYIEKADRAQGRVRQIPTIATRLLGRQEINRQSIELKLIDSGNNPTIVFGQQEMQGIGGLYHNSTGIVEIETVSFAQGILTPTLVHEDIVDTSVNYSSMEGMGSGATMFHEWVHWYHDLARGEAMRILKKHAQKLEQQLIDGGEDPAFARQVVRKWLDDSSKKYRVSSGQLTWNQFWNLWSKRLLGRELFDENDTSNPQIVPMQRRVLDFSKYADYGYASQEEMEEDFLIAHYELAKSGYQQGGLLEKLHEKYVDPQTGERLMGKALSEERSRVAQLARESDEPFTRTRYGQSKPVERVAEGAVGTFLSQFRNVPFMVNDKMIRLLNTFFMRRDSNGPLEEQHGIRSIRRRKRRRGGSYETDQYETMEAVSTIRAITQGERRGPDGHKESLRSAGRVSAVDSRSMRFDPDERSRLRSGASNIGLDTDERLYAFDEPISVSDFRARARTLSIGDHHFYDTGVPYSQSLGSRRRAILGLIAGRAYVNRTRPHEGDMIRAISATQFGMFVDDLPTYDTTTETDRAMLRGLVSGRIVDLPQSSRVRIENALKNATHIHSAVQSQTPNKYELYRVVNTDSRSFIEGLVVGERIPMPITAFARTRPRADAGETVIRIQKGAKSIDVDDGQFLTQGTFEVVALDRVDGQITVTLKHVETYDPRHDAMRPVDRFSDKPGAMRKFGSPRPRYTRQEQQRMEVDLARRTDKAEIDEQMYGLRSSGSTGLDEDIDRELDALAFSTERRTQNSRNIVKALRARIRGEMQTRVDKRLDQARNAIANKYQGLKPWRNDADGIRRYVSFDPSRRQEVLMQTFTRVNEALQRNDDGVDWLPNTSKMLSERITERYLSSVMSLEVDDLDSIINDGMVNIYHEGRNGARGTLVGRVQISITEEEREVFVGIRDMLSSVQRAYLIDNPRGQTIDLRTGTELVVMPETRSFANGASFSFSTRARNDADDLQMFSVQGVARARNAAGDGDLAGTFTRTVRVRDGKLFVEHNNMNMTGAGGGAATVINQHSWQWWNQSPGTVVVLSAASDGPIVWPRHGFHPSGGRNDFGEEYGVNFDTLIDAVSYVIGATSEDPEIRKQARSKRSDMFEDLAQVRVDAEGRRRARRASSRLRDEILGMTGFDSKEQELSDSDRRMRERLGLWLALAVQDRSRLDGKEFRKATIVMLANLLDPSDMDDVQLNAWKSLFSEVYHGQYKIELDGVDNDPDYLPSFVISDDDPTASVVARRLAIAEERAANANMDLFIPSGDDEDSARGSFAQASARVSRINALYENSLAPDEDGNVEALTNQAVLAREMSGGDALPRLVSVNEAEVMLSESINGSPSVDSIRPWSSVRDSRRERARVVLVGITQNSRLSHDSPSLVEVAGNFLRGNRTIRWDEADNRFVLDPIFTSTPGEFAERFGDTIDPTVDPATNKVGLLGITDQNARWITRYQIGEIQRTARDVLDRMSEDDPESFWGSIRLPINFRYGGNPLFNREWWLTGYRTTLDESVLDEYLDENFPDADREAMRSIFGSLADHVSLYEAASGNERIKIRAQTQWLHGLFTRDNSNYPDSRSRQTLASLLGYDFLDETDVTSTRSTVHVLNRGALTMVDEPVSLSDINKLTGIKVHPIGGRPLRSSGMLSTMMLDDDAAPTLLRLDDPLGVTATQMRTQSYSRLLRQDYGINPPRSLRSSGTRSYELMMEREREWFAGRNDRRQVGDIDLSVTPKMYADDIDARMERYTSINDNIEAIDDELIELDNRLTDLTEAGELTPELDKSIDDEYWSLEAQKTQLEMDKKDIADSIASDINTLNEIIDVHEQREGLAFAIRKFLSEPLSLDIPELYKEKLRELLADLDARAAQAPSTKDIKARHKILSNLLDDDSDFDIRWDITREETTSYNDDVVEGVDLEDFDDDFEWAGEKWLEWIYRSFFDPSYEEWRDSRISRAFEKQTEAFDNLWRIMGMDPPERKQSPRRMLEDMIDNVVRDITGDERRLWSREHDEILRNEYNADYEEAAIDATPSDSLAAPRNVPERIWKKIVASARLARRTTYEGERDAALRTAKRLIEPHRPDLADDDYLMSLRSSGSGAPYPMISGVNFNRMGLRSRGAAPEVVTVPKPDRFHSRLIERLSKYGIKDQDLAVDGKYGRVFAALLSGDTPFSIEQLERIIDDPDESFDDFFAPLNDLLPEPITAEDKEVLKEIIKETAKIASQSGWGILEIEGHRVKKINGAYHEELVDVLVDEVDLAMIRAMGAPTYERITKIHAVWARNLNRLNKMFGAYESRGADGAVVRVGSDLVKSIGAYDSFLDGGDAKIVGYFVEHRDIRGNLVMTVSREIGTTGGRITTPQQLILGMGEEWGSDSSDNAGTTNDAIMEAMFNAVGIYDYTIRSENDFDKSEPTLSHGRSLSKLRERLAKAREQAQMISFSPTPAGRHMEEMFLNEIKWLESHIQMYERIGQRFVKLLQESEGLSKDEVGARLKILANKMSMTNDVFTNGSPAVELANLSMYELALSAFNSMRLASRNVPRITDGHMMHDGTHEIGHFIFGQAFTRHGEYMSNLWPYVTMGPEFWTNFVRNQERQSDIFDRMTIEEGLGLKWTAQQRELYKSLSDETKKILRKYGIVNNNTVAPRRSDAEKFRNDIIEQVRQDPTISEIEKAEIITSLQKVNFHYETVLTEGDKNLLLEAIDDDLTPDVMRALGIDPLNEENPHVANLFTDRPWNKFVRIEPSDLGWQRTSASGSSLRSSGAPTNTVNRPYRGDDEQIIKLAEEGLTIREIAERIGINYRNTAAKIQRLRKAGKIGKIKREPLRDDSLTVNRRIARKQRLDAYVQYHQNLINGMSRAKAVETFLEAIDDEDFRVISERGTRETRKVRLEKLLELLEAVNAGAVPDKTFSRQRITYDEYNYILINEMKLLGFSVRETADQLKLSIATVNKYRQLHYRTYRSSETPRSLRSSGGGPSLRSSGENISTFGQMLRDQELAEASRLATAPSRGETPISDEKRRELVSIGRRSRMTEERLDSLVITEKAESEFTVAEYEEVTRLLDDSDTKLDKASEMLEDKRMRLQDEQWNLQNLVDANRATDRQYVRLSEVEELLENLERQEEILNRGYEANRLARLMIRSLRANSNNPRRDEYDNKYIIIRNADGTLAGMTMWGFLGVDVTFNTPEVPYAVDATALPAEDRITGRMVFVDFLMSFQSVPGMGSYLFKRVLEDARGRNARKVFLEVTDSSRPYWEQVGFAERRIAGSTSQYHEYVARVDEMLEAIESSGSTLRSSGSTLRSSGGNETKKPKREMRSIPGISGLWPHYTHSGVLISPQVRPKLRTARGSRRRHTAGPLQVTGYDVTIEFDDNPKTADSYRTMPFASAIQAARYIDEHMNAGSTVNDGKLITKREYIGRIGTTA